MSIEQKGKEQMEQLIAPEEYNEKHEIFLMMIRQNHKF